MVHSKEKSLWKNLWVLFLFLFGSMLVVNAETDAKGNRVTIHVTNASLLQIFNQIEKQTTYHFSYLDSEIDNRADISMSVNNASVPSVLNRALKGRSLTYRIVSAKSIVISKKKESSSARKSSTVGSGQPARSGIVVRGTVKDEKGDPVIGATVRPQGSRGGTVTDLDGRFEVEAPNDGVLEFSYIGYKTQLVNVGGKRQFAVTMVENVNDLNETVVVGYGTMKKRDLTGSITSIKGDKMTDITVPQPLMALQGKAAGVLVTQNTGDPSGNFKIRIRGNNSIKGNNDPLILVDGVPAYASSIDPYDIESVEILKDASATAIYGSRGANGVVLITSKKGKKGKTSIQYDGSVGVQTRMGHYDLMNSQEYAKFINIWQTNDVGDPFFSDDEINAMGEGYDWQDAAFHDAMITQHHLSVNGGNDKTQAMLSGSVFDRDGLVKESSYRKINVRSNVTHNFDDHFTAVMNFSYSNAHGSTPQQLTGSNHGQSIIGACYAAPPLLTPYNDDGSYRNLPSEYPYLTGLLINPMNYLYETSQKHKAEVLEINGYLAYKPIKGLTLKTSLALQSTNTRDDGYKTSKVINSVNSAWITSANDETITNENTINYTTTFAKKHDLNLMAGYTYQQEVNKPLSMSGTGFISDGPGVYNIAGADKQNPASSSYTKWVLASWLGRINYSYAGRYMATFSMRADGSSRYSEGNKWGYFPSAALAWRASEEKFMKSLTWIDNLKLRLGYGETGSTAISPYQTLNTMWNTQAVTGNGVEIGYTPSTNYTSDLKWETTAQWNIGIDLAMFNSRLRMTADYYIKNTRNLLNSVPKALSTGFTSSLQNIGKMRNKGFELTIDYDAIRNQDMLWTVSGNISANRNKVVKLYGNADIHGTNIPYLNIGGSYVNLIREGEPLGVFYTYKEDGYDENGHIKYVDFTNDGKISNDDRYISGNPNPDFFYGLSSTFNYKGLELSLLFQGTVGNDIFNGMEIYNVDYGAGLNCSREALYSHWDANNTAEQNANAKYPIISEKQTINVSDRFIENGSYLRLKNISLGYSLPVQKWSIGKWVKGINVYVSAQNLFTISGYSGADPEVSAYGSDVSAGWDFLQYPSVRTYTFGMKLKF